MSIERPPLPPGFDQSRAAARRAAPDAWRLPSEQLAGLYRTIEERRDIRRFRPDPLPDVLLERLLQAAHTAPSVGLMQPWRFIVVRDAETRAAMQGIAQKERLSQAPYLDERALAYLDLKLEGIGEAPLSVCVCCDRRPGEEILGRHTIRDTDVYSTCLAIQNLWLAARAEGVGVGWVSFYDEDDVRALLGIPAHVVPVAWLCVGYPDERPTRPGLEAAGWDRRTPLEAHVFDEHWPVADRDEPNPATGTNPAVGTIPAFSVPAGGAVTPGDHRAAITVRDRSDQLIKPQGSLGVLESLLERWATATGAPPPADPLAAILVLAADHGVAAQGTSLYPQRVSAQVAAAAARGESAIGVLTRAQNARLLVVDVGLRGEPRPEIRDARVAEASADITTGAAMSQAQFTAAMEAGARLAREVITGGEPGEVDAGPPDADSAPTGPADLLVLGEIGIANTTAASAVLAGLTGMTPNEVCGRGAGADAQGLERKRAVVARALAVNRPDATAPLEVLRRLGGLEFAGLAGAMLAAAADRVPVLLDGFAVGVVALAAVRHEPALRDYLFAGHRSAEPAHAAVLTALGLEPLLDQRLRLGEASGAALALPLIGLAGRLHAEMGTFDDSAVDRATA